MDPNPHAAETLALTALDWLVGRTDLLDVFMGATGSTEADLRTRMSEPEFLISVLDFILMDDAWVIAFSADRDIAAEAVWQARQALPGGAHPHWT